MRGYPRDPFLNEKGLGMVNNHHRLMCKLRIITGWPKGLEFYVVKLRMAKFRSKSGRYLVA